MENCLGDTCGQDSDLNSDLIMKNGWWQGFTW